MADPGIDREADERRPGEGDRRRDEGGPAVPGPVADQRGDQLQRLEKSLLRLERSNLQVLTLLQQLVSALSRRKPGAEKASADEGKEGAR